MTASHHQYETLQQPAPVQVKAAGSGSSHAPVIFFDSTTTCQHGNGVVGVTLTVDLAVMSEANQIEVTRTPVAYLRTSLQGAEALRNSLNTAILMAAPTSAGAS